MPPASTKRSALASTSATGPRAGKRYAVSSPASKSRSGRPSRAIPRSQPTAIALRRSHVIRTNCSRSSTAPPASREPDQAAQDPPRLGPHLMPQHDGQPWMHLVRGPLCSRLPNPGPLARCKFATLPLWLIKKIVPPRHRARRPHPRPPADQLSGAQPS